MGESVAKKVNCSFKENDEDIKLYIKLQLENDKSHVIKEALKLYYRAKEGQQLMRPLSVSSVVKNDNKVKDAIGQFFIDE